MRAITLWQPYASLIFTGHKKHETRSHRYPALLHGYMVAIHAAARPITPRIVSEQLHELCMDVFGCSYNFSLPRGAVLGTVQFIGAEKTEAASPADDDDEVAGDWRPGRLAWLIGARHEFPEPIPAKGKQGWWEFTPPAAS